MAYWLMKSEPSEYSIDDLKREKRAMWDGIRNYQARNYMRDEMKVGDHVLFYHSSCDAVGVVGVAQVASRPYDDPTQFDKNDKHYDPKSKKESPTWQLVDVKFVQKFTRNVTLGQLKDDPFFSDMLVTRRGMRLSIQPVGKKHFDRIIKLGT